MTYTAPDGHQYIAVVAGVGGGAMVTQAMPGFPARGGTLYVFTLDRNIASVGETPQQGTQSGAQGSGGTANKGKR